MIQIQDFPSDINGLHGDLRETLVKALVNSRGSKASMSLLKETLEKAQKLCLIVEKDEAKRQKMRDERQAKIEAAEIALIEDIADEEAELEEELAEELLDACGLTLVPADPEEADNVTLFPAKEEAKVNEDCPL